MLKLKHVLHPLWAASAVKALISWHWNVRRLVSRGGRRFRNDLRYKLQNVIDHFPSPLADTGDDTALLGRICESYIRATRHPSANKQAYRATDWWQGMRQGNSDPVRQALTTRDIHSLRRMFQNFFRDPCSAGLVWAPPHIAKARCGKPVTDTDRHFFLSDALHRIDYWKAQTGDRFTLRDLSGPGIGNPFGVLFDDVFVSTGAEYQHYCARRICDLLPYDTPSVVEIGGGFGGMAYYLLRNRRDITYVNFDLPESLALASYYLLKSFPHLSFLLYGERSAGEPPAKFNVVLKPLFELDKLPAKSIDLTFSSHAMSDLSNLAIVEYINQITRTTRKSFLYIGNHAASVSFKKLMTSNYPAFALVEKRTLDWNGLKYLDAKEVELLYQINANA